MENFIDDIRTYFGVILLITNAYKNNKQSDIKFKWLMKYNISLYFNTLFKIID